MIPSKLFMPTVVSFFFLYLLDGERNHLNYSCLYESVIFMFLIKM